MGQIKNEITVNGIKYFRLYDENGELLNDKVRAVLNGKDIEKAIEELQQFDLMKVIENKGVKYYRMLEPETKSVPFNVLNT